MGACARLWANSFSLCPSDADEATAGGNDRKALALASGVGRAQTNEFATPSAT